MNTNSVSILVASHKETDEVAAQIGAKVSFGTVVGLTGALGAGKTYFVRALVDALGGVRKEVSSPSYTLQYEYSLPDGRIIEHWDLYRVQVLPEELFEPVSTNTVRVIEWWEKFPELSASLSCKVEIEILSDSARHFHMTWGV